MPLIPRDRRAWRNAFLRGAILFLGFWVALLAALFWTCDVWMPGSNPRGPIPELTTGQRGLEARLRRHLQGIVVSTAGRNVGGQHEQLLQSAAYIETTLLHAGYAVESQEYMAYDLPVRNLWVELPGESPEILIIGGHYDCMSLVPGADDNASGAAAMLAIAEQLHGRRYRKTVRFIAWVNEEPPFFQTRLMGSLKHAELCREKNERIAGVISLESIAYYSTEPNSQKYPITILKWFYGSRGDFLGMVSNQSSATLVAEVTGAFRRHAAIPCHGFAGPDWISGIDWSDHWSYWQEGYPALMITDTAIFRNPHYHQETDAIDTLDFHRYTLAVDALTLMIEDLAGAP